MTDDKRFKGLTDQEVRDSRSRHGENVLSRREKVSAWKLYLEKFSDPIIRILIVAWLLSMAISAFHCFGPENEGFAAFLEPLGIFFAIMLASTIGFLFEQKANRAFEVLNTVNDDVPVTVIRNAKVTQVPKRSVVVGDIVALNTGDEVPADGTLLEAVSLQINESTLTGEPVVSKTVVEADFDKEATYPSDKAMSGTTVVDGHGVMRVDSVGDATEYGQVNNGVTIDNGVETPLQQQLSRLAKVISRYGYAVAAITFVVLTVKTLVGAAGMPWIDVASHLLNHFMVAVTLIVVAVPEGLPMSVTLSLALSMNRMLKANNLVRKMHACETMGATTVICTDKTGTLTQNKMQVQGAYMCGVADYRLHGTNDTLHGTDDNLQGTDDKRPGANPEAQGGETSSKPAASPMGQGAKCAAISAANLPGLIAEGISVNSTASLSEEDGQLKAIGNPTEGALLLWLKGQGADYAAAREGARVLSQLTFSTERKYMATVVYSPVMKANILYVKGAPEIVMTLCKTALGADGTAVGIDSVKMDYGFQLLSYQQRAMRTLGFAYRVMGDGEPAEPYSDGFLTLSDLTFIGVVGISDPVRDDVPDAVRSCVEAGIDIKIVTGDTPGTAGEIGRQIGVISKSADVRQAVISGPEFAALTDDEAAQRLRDIKIMCRARPSDKQRLVRLLQAAGEVVAVTGDGTNDAPALKAAQVGLSMGDGTSVAKEASDITIIDNSFRSIASAVMWGRSLYHNIQRFLLFQLTINVAASAIVLLGSLFGTESPLTITQMLWVNLIMDTFAAGAFASLPPSMDVMKEKPRKSGPHGDFIISRGMTVSIAVQAALFVAVLMVLLFAMNVSGGLTEYELSLFFTFFVMLQFWNTFNAKAAFTGRSALAGLGGCRSFLGVLALVLVGQVLIVTFGGRMFNVVPLGLLDWAVIIAVTSLTLWIGEVVRLFGRRGK